MLWEKNETYKLDKMLIFSQETCQISTGLTSNRGSSEIKFLNRPSVLEMNVITCECNQAKYIRYCRICIFY